VKRQVGLKGRIFLIFCLLTYDVMSVALACRLAAGQTIHPPVPPQAVAMDLKAKRLVF